MKRRRFLAVSGASLTAAASLSTLGCDARNFVRSDIDTSFVGDIALKKVEGAILYLASLAPSGNNSQPWFVKREEPNHWIIGNDSRCWLPAVEPDQRETMLYRGAFLQNLEYVAAYYGYACRIEILAKTS